MQVEIPHLGDADVEAAQFRHEGAHDRPLLFEGPHVSQQDVELGRRDPHADHATRRRKVLAMHAYLASQVHDAEAPFLAAGVPLMARAAAALAEEVARLLPQQGSVLLLVGAGNNGGDALLAGAELARTGHRVHILPTSTRLHEEGLSAAVGAGATVEDADASARLARSCDVLVDGIVGTGSAGDPALRGAARAIVESVLPVIREPKHPLVVAVDLPSGVDPDDGTVPAPAVLPADLTVTFGAMKVGLLRPPARAYAGRIVVVDIGIGAELAKMEPAAHYELAEAETA